MGILELRGKALELWIRCERCRLPLERASYHRHFGVCPYCGHHHRLTLEERIAHLFDANSFQLQGERLRSTDPLGFSGGDYGNASSSSDSEAMIFGRGRINGQPCVAVLMDFFTFGGSMGAVVGEVFCRACELCIKSGLPLLMVTASGGARMQEGTIALLQMAKTMVALTELDEAGIPSVSLLCDPTCGGVTASFATAADIILAEPGALICFSGPRVVEQTTGIKLPPDFSRAERLLERGLVDKVVPRASQRRVIGDLLAFLRGKEVDN